MNIQNIIQLSLIITILLFYQVGLKKKNESPYDESNIPYDFKLLFRASRVGNTPTDFHAKCDNKEATIVKIPHSEQILG